LAHLAAALANEGQRVLITAFTHRAINNALVKIAKKTQYSHIIKIGQHQYAEDLDYGSGRVNNYNNLQESPFNPNSRGVIIGGTCFAVRTKRLQEMAFDTVIFDEAGQVTLPLAFAGMLAGTKYIFIGDHQQMPPVITAEHKLDWVSKSIFEMLYQYVPGTMLDTTYRMNNAINHFPSHTFYNGKLKTHPNNENGLLKLSRISARYANILDPQQPNIFVEIPHTNRGMRSPEEAEIAARVAVEAVACGVLPEEIAIVAPYRAQGRLIRKLLYEYGRDIPGIMQKIVVDTVERIQGQERDVVIISLTTSDPVHAAKRASFYFQPNRLNVAITRSRMKRIILGSPFLFTTRPDDQRLQKNVDLFYNLYRQSTIIKLPAEQEMELNPGSMA